MPARDELDRVVQKFHELHLLWTLVRDDVCTASIKRGTIVYLAFSGLFGMVGGSA